MVELTLSADAEKLIRLRYADEKSDELMKAVQALFDNVAIKEEQIQAQLKKIAENEKNVSDRKKRFIGYAFSAAGLIAGLSFLPAIDIAMKVILPVGAFVMASRGSLYSMAQKTDLEYRDEIIDRHAFVYVKMSKEACKEAGYQLLNLHRDVGYLKKCSDQHDEKGFLKYAKRVEDKTEKFKQLYQRVLKTEKDVVPSLRTPEVKSLQAFDRGLLKIKESNPVLKEMDQAVRHTERQLQRQIKPALVLDIMTMGVWSALWVTGFGSVAFGIAGAALLGANILQTVKTLKTYRLLKKQQIQALECYKVMGETTGRSPKINNSARGVKNRVSYGTMRQKLKGLSLKNRSQNPLKRTSQEPPQSSRFVFPVNKQGSR